MTGRNARWPLGGFVLVVLGLLAALAVIVIRGEDDARDDLTERFETRASLSATFARSYVDDLATREAQQATTLLAGDVTHEEFAAVVQGLGFTAAVLLDDDGHLLQVVPDAPALLGKDMTVEYQHLRTAVAGGIGVSAVVPSAVAREPIVAVATPYEAAGERRVISGAFRSDATPLDAYLKSVVPIHGGTAFIIDSKGTILAGQNNRLPAEGLADLPVGIWHLDVPAGPTTVSVVPVVETPWRVVVTAPTAGLYAPIESHSWASWALWVALAVAGIIATALFVRLRRTRWQAVVASLTDELTGLPNRRAALDRLGEAASIASRHGTPFAVLMVDIDRFKAINDTYGHDGGDVAIRLTGDAIARAIRTEDVVARWGGEEFIVLLHHASRPAAIAGAERVRAAIAAVRLPKEVGGQTMTASIGLGWLGNGSVERMLRAADDALYAAKAAGRDCVVAEPERDIAVVEV